jgi:hypothetical protein
MKYRKLRIAFSAVCGIICLLLIALWVRSHYWNDVYAIHVGAYKLGVQSVVGRLWFVRALNTVSFHQRITNQTSRNRLIEIVRADENAIGFYFGRPHPSSSDFRLSVPHWWFVVPAFVLAALPWIHWSNRFSLRTLLIATTLVAILLGLIVYAAS